MVHAAVREYLARTKVQLQRLPPVAAANRVVKARQLKAGLKALQQHYAVRVADSPQPYSGDAAMAKARAAILERVGPTFFPKPAGSLRVFWVGANRDQDESGFLQALRKIATVIEFRNWQGGYGQWFWDDHGRVQVYDPAIVARNDACLQAQLYQALQAGPVDLLMGQMWANYLSVQALSWVREQGFTVLNVSLDGGLTTKWAQLEGTRPGAVVL